MNDHVKILSDALHEWERESLFGSEYLVEPGWWANDANGRGEESRR
jgi:hypothetical protein